MSNSRRRYHAIKKKLRQLLPQQWAECETRMVNLSLLVSAIPKAKELTQPALAAEMPVEAQETSLVQRQRRWVKNEHIDERDYYQPLIQPFLQALSQATFDPGYNRGGGQLSSVNRSRGLISGEPYQWSGKVVWAVEATPMVTDRLAC